MKIVGIEDTSTGMEVGLAIGDDLVAINGSPVRDVIDFRFLVAEEAVELEVLRTGQKTIYEIEKDFDDDLGLAFEDIQIRYCGNDCPFCFVDQNPGGMRSALYFRDEDFRLSFLSGHYVTLTNLSKKDMDRIVWQRLSPIFVSVHATDREIRKFLFGIKHDDRLFEKLRFLTSNGIEIHTQIVLCPEINDGAILARTIADLSQFLPNLRSVSIVPVGLTKHRQGLKKLKPVTRKYAIAILNIIDGYAADYRSKIDEGFVYASDEFYVMAGQPFPPADRYDGFYQKENGVGLVRHMLDRFEKQRVSFPKSLPKPTRVTLVTASLASGFMRELIVPRLNETRNLEVQLVTVENQFYGSSIHITGLLTAQDICKQLSKIALGDRIYLPANCVNDQAIFLDDWSIDRLIAELRCPVSTIDGDFSPIFAPTIEGC